MVRNNSLKMFKSIIPLFVLVGLMLATSASGQDFYDLYSVKEVRIEFKQDNWAEILLLK